MSSRSSSPEIEGAVGGEEAPNSTVDSFNLAQKMEMNSAVGTEMDSFYHNNKKDLMFELRQIQHGEKPVTGQEHRDKINNFLSKLLQVQAQTEGKDNVPANVDNVEEHRPEAIVVEVEGLYERRPVSSLLHSNAFRRQLDNIIRRGVSGLSFSPRTRSSSQVSVNPVPIPPSPRVPPLEPSQEVTPGQPSSQPQRHVQPSPPPSLPRRPEHQSVSTVQEPQNLQDVPPPRLDDIPSPQAPFFDQMRPVQEDLLVVQRETIIQEISELVHQGLVSSSLEGGFRGTLEVLMGDRLGRNDTNGERVRDIIHSLPRDPLHRRNDFSHLGLPAEDDIDNISVTTVSASAIPYTQTNLHLRREVATLKNEITEMKNMLKMNLELQLDIQRAIRQEVAAAVSDATSDQSINRSSSGERRYRPVNDSECLICLENPVNSVLYQCGHMCVCYCCGKHLIHQGAKCPICRAPIKDIIQAFSSNGK